MRRIAQALLVLLGVYVVVEVAGVALRMWAWRSRNPRALHLSKCFNKYVENPQQLRLPGRSGFTAAVHHVGRRSATPYTTPVVAHQSHEEVIIPLPYGTDVDWLRNLQEAGRGVVDLQGQSLQVEEPAVVAIDDVIGLLPTPMVRTIRLTGAGDAVRLHVSGPAAPESA